MKSSQLLILLLLVAGISHAQHALTGVWTGSLKNDSSTIRNDQSFEIALTQYKEKVYGYSRTTFIVRDTLYYVLKRVKGTIDGDVCEIKDDEIISYNFPGKIDKGVKVTATFHLNKQDSTWRLDGNWKTNKTKNFYSISGSVSLKEETNPDLSKIIPHLQELNLDKDVAIAKKPEPAPVAKAETKPISSKKPDAKPEEKKDIATSAPPPANKPVSAPPTAIPPVKTKTDEGTIASGKQEKTNNATTTTTKPDLKKSEMPAVAAPSVAIQPVAAAKVAERRTQAPQLVNFHADSLEISIYDNGEIDGDTVSVLLNGEIILAKQGLKASAIKKTIYINSSTDEITLVLYAENLGKYPPNTGLLVVHDGEDTYQVRFSADLEQNAAIIFRRKK